MRACISKPSLNLREPIQKSLNLRRDVHQNCRETTLYCMKFQKIQMNKQILPLSQNKSKKFASTWAIHSLRTNTVGKSIKLTMIANRSMIVKLPMIIRAAHNTLTLNSTFKAFLVNWLSKKQNSIKYWMSWIMLLVLKNENLTQNKRKKMKWCRELICWDSNQFETTLAKWLSRELKKARHLKDSQLTWILRQLKIKEICRDEDTKTICLVIIILLDIWLCIKFRS